MLLLSAAACWSAALIALAFLLSSTAGDVTGTTRAGQSFTLTAPMPTLVQVNGPKVLLPIGLPLLAVVVVAGALRRRRVRGTFGPGPLALGATIVTGGVSLIGVMTVGPFIVPVAVLLVLACVRAPVRDVVVPASPWPPPLPAPRRPQ